VNKKKQIPLGRLGNQKEDLWMEVSVHPEIYFEYKLSFQFRNEQFFARSRAILQDSRIERLNSRPSGRGAWRPRVKFRNYAEAYKRYAAQVIPQIDAEIAEKGHFWIDFSVHPEMVDFGFRQGPSEFSTAGIARYVED
jgi:hypothetical protein